MNIQDKMQEIHHKYGVTEKANYETQLYVETLLKDQKEQLILHGVSGSLPTKKYEIDFGTHLRCGIDVTNNELNILGAMDGWGNGVSKDVIVIKEL